MEGSGEAPKLKLVPKEGLELQIEPLVNCWAEGMPLMVSEFAEMEPDGREPNPDFDSIQANERAGLLKVLTARKDGRLIGYLSWMINFDMESYGTLIVNVGSWYVEPGHFGVAHKMFDWAMDEFKRKKVKFVYWHHPVLGRGSNLGSFFYRKGAELVSYNYVMKL